MNSVKGVVVPLEKSGLPEAWAWPFLPLVPPLPRLQHPGLRGVVRWDEGIPIWAQPCLPVAFPGLVQWPLAHLHPVYPFSLSQRQSQGRGTTPLG